MILLGILVVAFFLLWGVGLYILAAFGGSKGWERAILQLVGLLFVYGSLLGFYFTVR